MAESRLIKDKGEYSNILSAIVKSEENERSRLTHELHGCISPLLAILKLYIQSMSDCHNEDLLKQLIIKSEHIVKDAISSLSEISIRLNPKILRDYGIIEAIKNVINKISLLKKIKIHFETNLQDRLNELIEITLYRIFIELLTNTLKNDDATDIKIILNKEGDIALTYQDNGTDISDKRLTDKKASEIYPLKSRVESLHGEYTIQSVPGKGIKYVIKVPVDG